MERALAAALAAALLSAAAPALAAPPPAAPGGATLLSAAAPGAAVPASAAPAPAAPPPTAPAASAPGPAPALALAAAQGEAAPPRPERVSFAEATRRAGLQAPQVIVAGDEVRRAEALLAQVRSSSLPLASGNALYTRLDAERRAPGTATPSLARDTFTASAGLSAPLVAPSRWAAWSHAGEAVGVAQASEADLRRSAVLTAARAYLAIVSQRRVVEVSRSARDIAAVRLGFARKRRQGGLGTALDVARAEQQVAASEVQLEGGAVGLLRAQEALGIAAGGDGPLDAADEPDFALPAPVDPAAAEERRSDAALAWSRLAAAERVARDSWLDWLPTLLLTAQAFYDTPATVTAPETGWQVQFVLSVPLYDGGLRSGQAREHEVLAGEGRTSLDATLRQVRSDVRLALAALARQEVALSGARRAAGEARTALDLTGQGQRAGVVTDLEVSVAQQQSRDADLAVVVAEDAVRQTRLDLLAGLGQFP